MPDRMRAWPAVTLVLALLLAACGGENGEPTFTEEQLDTLLLQEGQAPEGASLREPDSGPVELEDVWQSECCQEQQDATREAGWQATRLNVFVGEEGSPMFFALSAAMLFEDGAGAGESIAIAERWITEDEDAPALLVGGLSEEPGAAERIAVEGLGEDAVGFVIPGDTPRGEVQTIAVFWRVGNASLQARGVGPSESFGVDDVRSLADAMNENVPD